MIHLISISPVIASPDFYRGFLKFLHNTSLRSRQVGTTPVRGEPVPVRGELVEPPTPCPSTSSGRTVTLRCDPHPFVVSPYPFVVRPVPVRGEPVPVRGEPVPVRGEPVPVRGEPVPVRGEPVEPPPLASVCKRSQSPRISAPFFCLVQPLICLSRSRASALVEKLSEKTSVTGRLSRV